MNSLISIIIPIYNSEKYLEECIMSAIHQTYKNLEIILIDDGSTDKSPQICEKYKKNEKRIKVIHKKNGGLSDSRNCGIKESTGKYLFFLDSDDIIQENTIEILYNAIKNNEDNIAICDFERFDNYYRINESKNVKIQEFTSKDYFYEILTLKENTYVCGMLIPKKYINNDFFIKDRYFEDMACMYKIVAKCKKIYKIYEKLYKYRNNINSIVHTINNKKIDDYNLSAQEMVNFIRKNYAIEDNIYNIYICEICRSSYIMSLDETYLVKACQLAKKIKVNELTQKNKIKIIILKNPLIAKLIMRAKYKINQLKK